MEKHFDIEKSKYLEMILEGNLAKGYKSEIRRNKRGNRVLKGRLLHCREKRKVVTCELYPNAEHAEILNTRKTIIEGSTRLRFWSLLSASRMNSFHQWRLVDGNQPRLFVKSWNELIKYVLYDTKLYINKTLLI